MSEWEQHMSERARARDLAAESAEYEARQADQRAALLEREPEPPDGCHVCWEAGPHPSFPMWKWWHVWPEDQPFENWVCHHECHGPGGAEQQAIAYA